MTSATWKCIGVSGHDVRDACSSRDDIASRTTRDENTVSDFLDFFFRYGEQAVGIACCSRFRVAVDRRVPLRKGR
jgi:hypothetical protein